MNDLYIYCEVEQIIKESRNPKDDLSYKKSDSSYIFVCKINDANEIQKVEASNFYVLEHWSRIFDAVHTKPVDERESFKSSSASSSTTNSQGKIRGKNRIV